MTLGCYGDGQTEEFPWTLMCDLLLEQKSWREDRIQVKREEQQDFGRGDEEAHRLEGEAEPKS